VKGEPRSGVLGVRPSTPVAATEEVLPRAECAGRLPVVALVGRPNTGKSTLFNRLTRSHRAVVASTPGVTRDRNVAPVEWGARRFLAVDTGGFEDREGEEIGEAVRTQSLAAAEEADAIVIVVDGRAGLSPLDASLVDRVRRLRKPLFLAVNKADTMQLEDLAADFYALGLEVVCPISAEHGLNVDALFDRVVASLPPADDASDAPDAAATLVAVVGRPNVGKSSLVNRLVGYERAIVAATPGTTRDAVDTAVARGDRRYLLVDTAGVRRRAKVHEIVERASVVRALRALERAEVALLVVDGTEPMTEQDARISSYAWERGRALVLLVNKWDAVPAARRDQRRYTENVERNFPSLATVPKLFISARTGANVERIWGVVDRVATNHRQHLQTAKLNQVLLHATAQQAPAMVRGRRPRFFYATQTAAAPPTITIFTTVPEHVQVPYTRYLENQFRAAFPLEGTPLRFRFRARRQLRDTSRDFGSKGRPRRAAGQNRKPSPC